MTDCFGLNTPENQKEDKLFKSIVTPEMCYFCFDTLVAHLKKEKYPKSPAFANQK